MRDAVFYDEDGFEFPEVVILTGAKGAGKDTVADYLVEKYDYRKYAFATQLKEMVLNIDPILSYENVNDEIVPVRVSDAFMKCDQDEIMVKEKYPEYRNFMQKLATDGVRSVSPDFWTHLLLNDVHQGRMEHAGGVVITDVRFDNEDIAASEIDGDHVKWEIINPSLEKDEYSSHVSENGLSEDLKSKYTTIVNDGSFSDLYAKIDQLMQG